MQLTKMIYVTFLLNQSLLLTYLPNLDSYTELYVVMGLMLSVPKICSSLPGQVQYVIEVLVDRKITHIFRFLTFKIYF